MFEINETSPSGDLRYGHTAVGPTAVPVTPNSIQLVRGLLITHTRTERSGPATWMSFTLG